MDRPHQATFAVTYLTSTFHHKIAIKIIPNLQSEGIKWITRYLRALWSFWPRHYGIPGFNDLNNPIWLAEKLDFPFGCRRQFSIIADGKTVKVWEVKNWLRNLRLVLRPYVAQPNNVSGWIFAPNENSLEAEHGISAEQSPNYTCSWEARHNRHPESHSCIQKNNPWCIPCTAQQPLRLNFFGNWREPCWTPGQLKWRSFKTWLNFSMRFHIA